MAFEDILPEIEGVVTVVSKEVGVGIAREGGREGGT